MINTKRTLEILRFLHNSEKSSNLLKNNNIVVFKVIKNASKLEIKLSIKKLFSIDVKNVCTLNVKGKYKKIKNKYIGHQKNWKKAYVTLHKGQNIDFTNNYKIM